MAMVGHWTFENWRGLMGRQTFNLCGASAIVSVATGATDTRIDGVPLEELWATEQGAGYAGPVVLPVIYDQQRRVVPYRYPLTVEVKGVGGNGSVQQLQLDPAMYSDTHHLELRFLPLAPLGSTEPAQLTVEGAAVLLRISNYNPGAAAMDGLSIFNTLRTGPIFDVKQDWPPVYDEQWRVIPYRHTFRFSAQGGQPIQGAFTVVDVVPNR